jgi:hypothetical protein
MTAPVEPDKPTRRVKGNGRAHWMPLDAKDWLTDECLSECSPATQGIWLRMLLVMWTNGGYELVGVIDKLALKIGRFPDEVKLAISELSETGTADVFFVENSITKQWPCASQTDGKGIAKCDSKRMANDSKETVVIVRSRRLHKERGISKLRSEVGRKGAEKRWGNGEGKSIAPSSSSLNLPSSSAISSSSFVLPESEDDEESVF